MLFEALRHYWSGDFAGAEKHFETQSALLADPEWWVRYRASLPAHAAKDCGELKQEIAAKIDANGVKSYALEVVAPTPFQAVMAPHGHDRVRRCMPISA